MSVRGHRIMIVEDDADVRAGIVDLLVAREHVVLEASDGADAIQQLRTGTIKPCLILLDILMQGMNGWEFRLAQRRDPELEQIPVVVVTGHANAEGVARDLSAAGFVRKPAMHELVATVERVLHACVHAR